MNQYSTFIFESYSFDEQAGRIELNYSLDDKIHFTETIVLPQYLETRVTEPAALDRSLFALHLIGGISYFKTCLPKAIEVRSGSLTKEQAAFWNSVYENGLGEFFYKNKIDFRGLINFPAEATHLPTISPSDHRKPHVLTPIGGGKDSIVTIELLKKGYFSQTLLRVGTHPFINTIAKITGAPMLNIERKLSATLFDLNAQGALNGHVPITAYLSILSIVLAETFNYSHIAFSNERSANEGNVELFGKQINHQWSKSIEFERVLRRYMEEGITKNVSYINPLRPLSELHIVQLFSHYPQYFEHFTSCNANWKILKDPQQHPFAGAATSRWCGKCPKCAFAFALLSAYLDKNTMLKIFAKNLFSDAALVPLYKELLGLEGNKPFECVGTPEETFAALSLADDKGDWEGTPVMTVFQKAALEMNLEPETVINELLTPSNEHHLPQEFLKLIPQ